MTTHAALAKCTDRELEKMERLLIAAIKHRYQLCDTKTHEPVSLEEVLEELKAEQRRRVV